MDYQVKNVTLEVDEFDKMEISAALYDCMIQKKRELADMKEAGVVENGIINEYFMYDIDVWETKINNLFKLIMKLENQCTA